MDFDSGAKWAIGSKPQDSQESVAIVSVFRMNVWIDETHLTSHPNERREVSAVIVHMKS